MLITRRRMPVTFAAILLTTTLFMLVPLPAFADQTCYTGPDHQLICEVSSAGSHGTVPPPPPAAGNDGSGSAPAGGASGASAGSSGSRGATGNPNMAIAAGECAWRVLSPSPPAGDVRWKKHDPATGVILYNLCNGPVQYQFAASLAAAPPPPPPPPSPAVLAEQAYAELVLPKPSLGRSPDLAKGDPAQGGRAYTVVNLWTRYFSDPAGWVPTSKTVKLRGVFATVTATPSALLFDPGDGNAAVSCPGPGRPWRESDGFDPPGAGECGYQYRKVEAKPITGTESISWSVTWIGSAGAGGTFAGLTTSASSDFLVEQIQIVVKR